MFYYLAFILRILVIVIFFFSLFRLYSRGGTLSFIIFFIMYFSYPMLFHVINGLDRDSMNDPLDYARIVGVDFKATLSDNNSDNVIKVKETLTYDIHSVSRRKLFCELWRGMPEDKIDGLNIQYDVKSVTQILPDGSRLEYGEAPRIYINSQDYFQSNVDNGTGPLKWYHSKGPYNERYNQYECLMIYPGYIYRDTLVFEIEYEIRNVVYKYDDCSELYLQIYNEDTIKYLKDFNAEILIPIDKMPKKGNYYARAYGTNDYILDLEISRNELNPGYCTFRFNLNNDKLRFNKTNEFIEFLIVSYNEDKHIFSEFAKDNRYTNEPALDELIAERDEYEDLSNQYINKTISIIFVSVIASIALIIVTPYIMESLKRKRGNVYKSDFDYQYYSTVPSELDPLFACAFTKCKDTKPFSLSDGFAAVFASLIQKNIIEFEPVKGKIRINTLDKSNLYESEVAVLNQLQRSNLVSISNAPSAYVTNVEDKLNGNYFDVYSMYYDLERDYANTRSFVNQLKSISVLTGVRLGYYSDTQINILKDYALTIGRVLLTGSILLPLISLLLLINSPLFASWIGMLLLSVVMAIIGMRFIKEAPSLVKLTQFGEEEYEKWQSFRRYLSDENQYNSSTIETVSAYEQFLIYAIGFGIAKKVASTLYKKFPNITDTSSSDLLTISKGHYPRFTRISRNIRSSVRTSSHIRYSSSSYSRGGRGGGGGH